MKKGLGTLLTSMAVFSAGAITGILMAPKSGRDSRKWVTQHRDEARHWIGHKGHMLVEKGEKRMDKVSKGIRNTVHEVIPDLYEATESLHFQEDELEESE